MLDVIVEKGTVLDGSGTAAQRADVGIAGDRIVEVGDLSGVQAVRRLDASGLVVAPGFIDIHTHNNRAVEHEPMAESYLRQGVTTCVGGNCGEAPHPIRHHLEKVAKMELRTNYACLAGSSTIRKAVVREDRPANPDEVRRMQRLVEGDLEAGAIGLSSGILYMPFFETFELVAISGMARGFGSFHASHIRNEAEALLESIEEMLDIARASGAAVQVSHIKCFGANAWGKASEVIERIEKARADGLDVTADQYPYLASSTALLGRIVGHANELRAHMQGGVGRLLTDPALREAAQRTFTARYSEFDHGRSVLIAPAKRERDWRGRPLAEYLDHCGGVPFEETVKLCMDQEVRGVFMVMRDEDVDRFMRCSWVMAGSDGILANADGGYNHPRSFGTFPRFLARYVRERKVISLAEAVRKMTVMPAERLGFKRRGRIAAGMIADITVFNPETILDRADYRDTRVYPIGIEWVLIAGHVALEQGVPVQAGFGRVIRRGES